MNEETQRRLFHYLRKRKVENFVGVPDSTLKYFIDECIKQQNILITTREEEAIGIATGMSLSNSASLVFMQNAGFANSISTFTSLVQLYEIPIIFLIGWRGYLSSDAPEHTQIGKIQPDLLKIIGLKSKIITEKNWNTCCDWAIKQIRSKKPCALVIRRIFND